MRVPLLRGRRLRDRPAHRRQRRLVPVTPAGTPRVPPLPRAEWGEDERAALARGFGEGAVDRFTGDGSEKVPVPNAVGTLLRHPALAGPFLAYNSVLLRTPALAARHRELMILRVAHRTGSDYEWAQHVRIATGVGVTQAEIAAVADGGHEARWAPLEADLLRATDELIDDHVV